MKKLAHSKLRLSRETLRQLQPKSMQEIAGGLIPEHSGEESCGTTTISCFQRCTG